MQRVSVSLLFNMYVCLELATTHPLGNQLFRNDLIKRLSEIGTFRTS